MLHALEKKKTNYYRRYLGVRDGHEKRVCEEDEITSTVFGALEFVDLKHVYDFWREVFRLERQSVLLPAESPNSCKFELWPKKNNIEPDAHFTFFWANGVRLDLLIELKWEAPLSGKDQLRKQWQDYLDIDVKNNCWHLFIAPDISAGLAARDSEVGNIWQVESDDRLILLSWAQIRDALAKFKDRSDGFGRWAVLTSHFLEKIGVRHFKGFAQAHRALPVTELLYQKFYSGSNHGFKGFRGSATTANEMSNSVSLFKSFFQGAM